MIEAMQVALEALEDANDTARMEFSDEDYYSEAINALRQAIEQVEQQKPVACIGTNGELMWLNKPKAIYSKPRPLYTAPVDGVTISEERVDEIVKQEHDKQIEIAQAYERGWNAALAQQEPVAWYDSKSGWTEFHSFKPVRKPSAPDAEWLPLYTAPPKRDLTCVCGAVWEGETMVHAPHQRKPLTYPQIHELDWPDGVAFEEILLFARAIEAAHGIRSKT
jgi:hypothetical protein